LNVTNIEQSKIRNIFHCFYNFVFHITNSQLYEDKQTKGVERCYNYEVSKKYVFLINLLAGKKCNL